MLKPITDDMIDDVLLRSSRTFIILFYSEAIPNLPNIMEVFEDFDKKFKGKIDVYKCDVDSGQDKMLRYFQMPSMPAMVMMKNNIPYANSAGPVSAASYENMIKDGIIKIMEDQKKHIHPQTGYQTIQKTDNYGVM